jgi:hypothetical protein
MVGVSHCPASAAAALIMTITGLKFDRGYNRALLV